MIYRRKLIEVSLPLEAISQASDEETKIHVGKVSNLHAWWSRKPLSPVRAVLFASLVDDPSEYMADETLAKEERERLFLILEKLVKWENGNNEDVLDEARLEIARSVARDLGVDMPIGKDAVHEFLYTKVPPMLDPFAGGGSIPLEAQRLGLRTYASDLNPVAVLINKALIEIPPKFSGMAPVHPVTADDRPQNFAKSRGSPDSIVPRQQHELWTREWHGVQGLAEDIRYYGQWMRNEAEKRIGHLYSKAKITVELLNERPDLKAQGFNPGDELTVISWLWARTVECPNPICGFQTPLVNKYWVSTHIGNEAWINPVPNETTKKFQYQVIVSGGKPPEGTVKKQGAKCQKCLTPIPFDYIREKGRKGEIKFDLMCEVAEGNNKRVYIPIQFYDDHEYFNIDETVDADLPDRALGFRVQKYGITNYRSFFTDRQLTALAEFSKILSDAFLLILKDSNGNREYAIGIITYLSIILNRLAQTNNTLIRWLVRKSGTSKGTPIFDRPILPMVWEFSEGNVFSSSVGSWTAAINNVLSAFSIFPQASRPCFVFQADASSTSVISNSIVSTDPPYFDNIGYGNLSDFFYVWLRKNLLAYYPELFPTLLSPKEKEIVKDDSRYSETGSQEQFITALKDAFMVICRNSSPIAPATFYYAFRQTESVDLEYDEDIGNVDQWVVSTGWEAMLDSLIHSGFSITGTWPIRTESTSRLRALGSNALASSIVLVCRPRPTNADTATRREFLAALKRELPPALRQLQQGSIAPVDLAQAAIGPGMAVFSRYAAVLEADGSPMRIRTALALINQALDEYLAEQEGEYDSDTRWALAWYEQFGHNEAPYGVAETLSKAKNTSVEGLGDAGILEARSGKVRLLRRDELEADWDPEKDKRLTSWESVQHLIFALDHNGEENAAALLPHLGSLGETARDLAYRLYAICERKGWAQDALAYNMLVVAWPRLKELASRQEPAQKKLL